MNKIFSHIYLIPIMVFLSISCMHSGPSLPAIDQEIMEDYVATMAQTRTLRTGLATATVDHQVLKILPKAEIQRNILKGTSDFENSLMLKVGQKSYPLSANPEQAFEQLKKSDLLEKSSIEVWEKHLLFQLKPDQYAPLVQWQNQRRTPESRSAMVKVLTKEYLALMNRFLNEDLVLVKKPMLQDSFMQEAQLYLTYQKLVAAQKRLAILRVIDPQHKKNLQAFRIMSIK